MSYRARDMEDGDPIRFLGYRGEIKSTPSHYFKGLALCPSLVATSEAHNVNKLTKGSQRIQLHREMRAQMRIQMQIRIQIQGSDRYRYKHSCACVCK